jgi:hypothetical protein
VTSSDTARRGDDLPAALLRDDSDRDELRSRYYGLLQENRVLLPGVQILVAFIITVPFNSRFLELDGFGEVMWGLALMSGCLAVITLLTPIVFHRVGGRTRRSARLVWGIRMQRVGIVAFGLSLVSAVVVVARFVAGNGWAAATSAAILVMFIACWLAVPFVGRNSTTDASDEGVEVRNQQH